MTHHAFWPRTFLAFDNDQTRDITVGIQSIVTNVTGSETSLSSSGFYTFIDSSIAQLYLPLSVCQAFEAVFGLAYKSTIDLYLVNDTLHSQLLWKTPSVTFKLGNTDSRGQNIDITLPYASFDLQASFPFVSNTTRYFPLKRAANETQYTLGRTFLQESYLIVDYERGNFSANPVTWGKGAEHIVAIGAANATNSTKSEGNAGRHRSLLSGALVGIVLSVVCLIAVAGLLYWFLVHVPPRKKVAAEANHGADERGDDEARSIAERLGAKIFGTHEVEGSIPVVKLNELQNPEHEGEHRVQELAAASAAAEGMNTQIFEMAGSDVAEMMDESEEKARKNSLSEEALRNQGSLSSRERSSSIDLESPSRAAVILQK